MAYVSYPNGAGGLTGDEIAVNKPLYLGTTGHIWYVGNAVAGAADAASPRGREREKPLATFGQAITNAAAGDVIILMENHAETITVGLTFGKALTVVGEGAGSTRPRLTCGAAIVMIVMGNAGSSLNNIYFPASITIAPTSRVDITSTGCVSDNCYFECGAFDTGRTVRFTSGSCQLTGATFVATASQPAIAVEVAGAMAALFLEDLVFDGGSFGFSDFALKNTGAGLTGLYANNISLLNNADAVFLSGWTGVLNISSVSGSARFEG